MTETDPRHSLQAALAGCMVRDRRRLQKRLQRLGRRGHAALAAEIERARERRERRRAALPRPGFPADLPITGCADPIIAAIREHQVLILCGETGSGKSTQLPKLCLAAGRGADGLIGHTQPRRLAARTLAARIGTELGTAGQSAVGYKIRHEDRTDPDACIKLMTDGILLAELRADPELLEYDTLIIDEAHERSLNIDFLLGYLRRLLPRRPDLRIIVTSATIDVERFSAHFDGAPIIEVRGRGYPVEVRYRPYDDDEDLAFEHAVLGAIRELSGRDRGDILIFLEGEREIHELAKFLRRQSLPDTDILPLYARLGAAGQGRIFEPHRRRHIVLATNVAETSLTIPGIRYVIDGGYARISRYSPRSKVQRLPIEKIARAAAEQRKGRCGREGPGICIRLYSAEDFEQRPEFTEPEIRRTNLAAVLLQMKALRLGDPGHFPFLDPPDRRQISDARRRLHELGALDESGRLTDIGARLARLPVDPAFGRMLLAAGELDCLREALVIVSALSIQDPRERPLEAQAQADAAHRPFRHERSDFLDFVNLWEFLETRAQKLSANQFRHLCREHFLAYVRVREWRDIYRQLDRQIRELGYRPNREPADYATLHTALATGLLGHVAQKTGPGEYTGARGVRLKIFPGSGQHGRQPPWIMAAELVETSQLFARTVAAIEPEWLLRPAAHLVTTEVFEPAWDREQQRVVARERVTLYGLPLVAGRPVHYGRVAPAAAREVFIRKALVEGELRSRAPFFRHQREVVAAIRRDEHKTRRPDILDEQALFDFYDRRLPAAVVDRASLDAWRRRAERADPQLLFVRREQLVRHEPETAQTFPDELQVNGVRLPVDYTFRPGADSDGMTIDVPLALLNQLDAGAFERLVPGLLEEKIAALLRGLPKRLRRQFVPIPETVQRCLPEIRNSHAPLPEALGACLLRQTGVRVDAEDWRAAELPVHLRPRFRVRGDDGRVLARGRDYAALQRDLGELAADHFASDLRHSVERDGIRKWDFGDLPACVEIERSGQVMRAYPALIDQGDRVAIRCRDTEAGAVRETRRGLLRLFMLGLAGELKYLRKQLPQRQALCLAYSPLGGCDELIEGILEQVVARACLDSAAPETVRTGTEFQARLEHGRPRLVGLANEFCELLQAIFSRHTGLRKRLGSRLPPQWLAAAADIREQLDHLVFPDFVRRIDPAWLAQYPRYLDAIDRRLQRLEQDPERDRRLACAIAGWWRDCLQLLESYAHAPEDAPPALIQYRWLLEEYRVSLFAQELKTIRPVSPQRLEALRDELRRAQ